MQAQTIAGALQNPDRLVRMVTGKRSLIFSGSAFVVTEVVDPFQRPASYETTDEHLAVSALLNGLPAECYKARGETLRLKSTGTESGRA